jgi:hypothetical protein
MKTVGLSAFGATSRFRFLQIQDLEYTRRRRGQMFLVLCWIVRSRCENDVLLPSCRRCTTRGEGEGFCLSAHIVYSCLEYDIPTLSAIWNSERSEDLIAGGPSFSV